jgi:hypothetical protein
MDEESAGGLRFFRELLSHGLKEWLFRRELPAHRRGIHRWNRIPPADTGGMRFFRDLPAHGFCFKPARSKCVKHPPTCNSRSSLVLNTLHLDCQRFEKLNVIFFHLIKTLIK